MKLTATPRSHATLADWVASALREAILSGDLAPGQHLSQQEISDQLQVSRVPVREALRELAAEGLVALRSYRGAVVTELTRDDLDECFALAAVMEGAVAAKGAAALSEDALDRMNALLDEMEACEDEPQRWYGLNLEFHGTIAEAAGWPTARKLLKEWRQKTDRFVIAEQIYEANLRSWHHQHREIYEACRARDAALARRLSESHWNFSHLAFQRHLKALNGTATGQQNGLAG